MINEELFGNLKDGRVVHQYTIFNRHGEYVQMLDYGASIHAIVVRDRSGQLGDVVLGARDARSLTECTYVGGTIGRCANRIAHGRYQVAGQKYQLETNCFGHFLHGASGNYAHKIFQASIDELARSVTFHLRDQGDGGFDCAVDTYVTFTFNDDRQLILTYEMEPENTTILNPTNHAYFNLGVDQDIREHILQINSEEIVTRGEDGFPDGGKVGVAGTPADFTSPRALAAAMTSDQVEYFKKAQPSYDEFYLLHRDLHQPAATLSCLQNGRYMNVYTDMPCLVLFTTGDRAAEPGKHEQIYEGYLAVCLETGFVPNAINSSQYDSPLFYKGDKLYSQTIYEFGTTE